MKHAAPPPLSLPSPAAPQPLARLMPTPDDPGYDDALADALGIGTDETLDTPPDASPELDLLRTQQRFAFEELAAGRSYTKAAANAGIDRKTLYRWVNHDPAFIAALQSWRRCAARNAEDCLSQGVRAAAVTLRLAARHDYRAAAILLKGRGHLGRSPAPAAAPASRVLAQVVPPGRRRDFEIRLRELILSFRDEPQESPAPLAPLALPAPPALPAPTPAEPARGKRRRPGKRRR